MAVPTNISEVTATDLGTLPASISQDVYDSGTTYTVWYKYTAPSDQLIGVFGFGALGGYAPTVTTYAEYAPGVYTDLSITGTNVATQVAVTSGVTYYFRYADSGNVNPSVLLLEAEAFVPSAVPSGSILLMDDTAGFPALILSAVDGDDNHILNYIQPFAHGEGGCIVRSTGHVLVENSGINCKLYDRAFNTVATVAFGVTGGNDSIRASQGLNVFYIKNFGGGATPPTIKVVDTTGAITATYTLPLSGLTGFAASNDGTILYAAGQGGIGAAIKRRLLAGSTYGADLAAAVAGYSNNSILVLADDTIVVLYTKSGDATYAVRFADDGTVLNTYSINADCTVSGRLAYALDDPTSFWVWAHPNVAGGGLSRFENIRSSDGAVLASVDYIEFETGAYTAAATASPLARFGISESCPFVQLGPDLGTIRVDKVTVPDASAQSFDFSASGGLIPTTFSLTDGTSQTFSPLATGSGYAVTETPVAGWSTSYSVSNGSPVENITVAADEIVVVTVTNTQMTPTPPDDGPCCGSTGPGNSPTSQGYSGSNPTGNTPPPPVTTPRVVPPGGAEPEYTICGGGGGGEPATAADPVNAQDMASAKTPLVHVKWALPDGSFRYYGKRAFTSGSGATVSARVLRWGSVSQVLSDHFGSFQAQQFTIKFSDADRALRTILSTAATKYIDGKEMEVYIETAANAALSVAPLCLARGIITNYKFNRDLTVDITVTDPLGYRYSSVSLDRPIPNRVIRKELFPDCPEQTTGRAAPIIYGDMSDDYTWTIDPARIPVGVCPIIHVGKANTIAGAAIPGSEWEAFVIAGHAIPCVQSVFGSNLLEPEGPVRLDAATLAADFLIPGDTAPCFYEVFYGPGVSERFALMFGKGDIVAAHLAGRVPITVNVWGIEDVGDGSGNVISDMALQFQHFLSNWVVNNFTTGDWPAVPTFTGGTAKVRTSSFATCSDTQNERLVGGYVGSKYLGEQKPAREWAKDFQVDGDMRLGVNNHGQLLAITLNDTASTLGLTTFTDRDTIVQESFDIDPDVDDIFNVYTYEYGPEPATGRMAGQAQTIRNATSITHHTERTAQASVNKGTRHKETADDVANRALLRSSDAPTRVHFTLDLRAVALSIGQLVRVTHYQGIGTTGWTSRVLMVTHITTNPDEDTFSCAIECDDVHDVLTAGAFAFMVDSGMIDVGTLA